MTPKDHILAVISEIPSGKVTSYGTVAEIVSGLSGQVISGRGVGRILTGMTTQEIQIYPWHRVISTQGYISALKLGAKGLLQQDLLLQEGIVIIDGYIDMRQYGWKSKDQKK